MKNDLRDKCLIACAVSLIAFETVGQNQSAAQLYSDFDKTIQVKNAAFNNGKVHFNPYRSIDKTTRYLLPDFIAGKIIFDAQTYGDVWLKYDVLGDELVVKFDGEGNKMGFSPVKQRISGFYIGETKFVNLDLVNHPDFISGFYEQNTDGRLKLFTKYYKDQFARLTDEKVLYTYVDRNEFVFLHDNKFFRIDAESDAVRAFPQFDKQIEDFFNTNAPLEKTDRRQFMKKLALHIDELLNTASK
jgi:hypothetical protein